MLNQNDVGAIINKSERRIIERQSYKPQEHSPVGALMIIILNFNLSFINSQEKRLEVIAKQGALPEGLIYDPFLNQIVPIQRYNLREQ